jgi:transposase
MSSLPDLSELSHAQKDELIVRLWAQLLKQEERIGQLEARLRLNSRNSSKPPSSDGLAKPAPKSLRLKGQHPVGGQKGHEGNTLRQSARIDEIIEHQSAPACPACQGEWSAHEVIDRRQVFELPVLRAQVTEHRLMRSTCRCGAVHEGLWPEGVNAPAQYGERAKALVVHLNQHQLVPLQRTCELMRDVFGLALSQASVLAFAGEAALALAPTVQAIGQAVQSAPVVHADETGIRIEGKLHWLHCLVTHSLSWLGHHAKRGSEAFEELGLLGGVRGTLVHDGLAGYRSLDCAHSLCNAHHLRELTFAHEHPSGKAVNGWAGEMKTLLVQANDEVAEAGGPLPAQRQAWFEAQWDRLLDCGERVHPEVRPEGQSPAKRGRNKQSKEFNLLRRLRVHRLDVWRFMTDKDVPFTNNLAEQALRMSKVRQKVSGCFRTQQGASTFFTIRSYLATMRKQRACLFECLISTFKGQPVQPRWAG